MLRFAFLLLLLLLVVLSTTLLGPEVAVEVGAELSTGVLAVFGIELHGGVCLLLAAHLVH